MSSRSITASTIQSHSATFARSSSILPVSISFAAYQYRAATQLKSYVRQIESRERQIDRLAADLAYDHGHGLCERGDVGQGMLWLVHGLAGAAHARSAGLERAFRLDLAGWRPIGHAIDREGQLDLRGVRASGGLYAPTLRHAAGRFQDGGIHAGNAGVGIAYHGQQGIEEKGHDGGFGAYAQERYHKAQQGNAGNGLQNTGYAQHRPGQRLAAGDEYAQRATHQHGQAHRNKGEPDVYQGLLQ